MNATYHPASIIVTPMQIALLQELLMEKAEHLALYKRIHLILVTGEGLSVAQIKNTLQLSPRTIYNWRHSWRSKQADLQQLEAQGNRLALKQAVLTTLTTPLPTRTTSPISSEQFNQILALRHEDPRGLGYHREFWTCQSLAEEAIARGIVDYITPHRLASLLQEDLVTH